MPECDETNGQTGRQMSSTKFTQRPELNAVSNVKPKFGNVSL